MPPDIRLSQRDESSEESKDVQDHPQPVPPRRSGNQEEEDNGNDHQQHDLHDSNEANENVVLGPEAGSSSFTIIHDTSQQMGGSPSPLRSSRSEKGNTSSATNNTNTIGENATTKRPRELTIHTIALGEQFDVLDSSHRWCEAEVSTTLRIYIHFYYTLPLLIINKKLHDLIGSKD